VPTNVALRVEATADADVFRVSGRGELHLTILLENMRREGFELAVGKPRVVFRDIDGQKCEPYENLTVDVPDENQGAVMEELGRRRGELTNMESDGNGRTRLEYHIPARGLIGFQGEFMTLTRGTGLMSHVFDDYAPVKPDMPGRHNGVLVAQAPLPEGGSDANDPFTALAAYPAHGRMFYPDGTLMAIFPSDDGKDAGIAFWRADGSLLMSQRKQGDKDDATFWSTDGKALEKGSLAEMKAAQDMQALLPQLEQAIKLQEQLP